MPFLLTMPKLSPTMNEGSIAKWLKKEGDFVEAGETVMEVNTDKAVIEYNAIDSGWIRKILVKEKEIAEVNQPLAIFTEEAKESIEGFEIPKKREVKKEAIVAPRTENEEAASQTIMQPAFFMAAFVPEPPLENYQFPYSTESQTKILATPLAKKIAKERGLDLSTVKGSGPNQRITSQDLEKAQVNQAVNFGKREEPTYAPGAYEEEDLSIMRKTIAQRLMAAKSSIPHFYITQAINAEPLYSLREQLLQGKFNFTFNDFIIKACAVTLREHPEINSGFNNADNKIVRFKTVDISVAVGTNEGLITPILRHADFKNLGEISVEMRHLAKRAKEGKLEAHEYKGGSFCLSNLGMYGITDFQAILNPPQAAILAVGAVQDVPVVKNGAVVPGKVMNLTLSVDHRVIDGVLAAVFLKKLRYYLETPSLLIVH